jgi:hypothetical protein
MNDWAARLRFPLAALWLGGLLAIAAIGAPTAFAVVSGKMLAAAVASRMFHQMALLGALCAGALIVLERQHANSMASSGGLLLVAAALALDIVGEFGVVPHLLAAAASGAADAARWHIAASAVYLAQTGCVLAYVWKLSAR